MSLDRPEDADGGDCIILFWGEWNEMWQNQYHDGGTLCDLAMWQTMCLVSILCWRQYIYLHSFQNWITRECFITQRNKQGNKRDVLIYSNEKQECKVGTEEKGRYWFPEDWTVFIMWLLWCTNMWLASLQRSGWLFLVICFPWLCNDRFTRIWIWTQAVSLG